MNLMHDIDAMGLRRGYDRYVIGLESVLEDMSQRGIPVSPAEHARVTVELTASVAAAMSVMQLCIPDEVRKCNPKGGYKKEPKGAVLGAATTHGKDKKTGEPIAATWARRWFPIEKVEGFDCGCQEERWCKLLQWKPSGGKNGGLIRYMKFKKHPVPRAFKTDEETTQELELRRLAKSTRDPLYSAVIEYRELKTLLSNHVANWKPGPDGRVHPTFYYETGTGQLGARRPNSMNAPKHKPNQGDIFRSMIVAKEGHSLVEIDYKAFHVQTLAFEARDPDLLRLGKLDIHSFLTAHFLRLPDAERLISFMDTDLRARLAEIKKQHKHTRDAKVKHALLGYNNGMGYRKCYYQYMEFFESQSEAKRIFELLDSLFPRAKAYRQAICDKAHQQGYLISRFGCIRWFWEVYKWSGGKWAYGDDHEAALSFFTQNDAHCHLKEAMLRLSSLPVMRHQLVGDKMISFPSPVKTYDAAERYGLINPIHDALMFECSDPLLPEAVPTLAAEMERPSDVLIDEEVAPSGLSVEVAVSVGKSWNKMTEVDWRTYGEAAPHRAAAHPQATEARAESV